MFGIFRPKDDDRSPEKDVDARAEETERYIPETREDSDELDILLGKLRPLDNKEDDDGDEDRDPTGIIVGKEEDGDEDEPEWVKPDFALDDSDRPEWVKPSFVLDSRDDLVWDEDDQADDDNDNDDNDDDNNDDDDDEAVGSIVPVPYHDEHPAIFDSRGSWMDDDSLSDAIEDFSSHGDNSDISPTAVDADDTNSDDAPIVYAASTAATMLSSLDDDDPREVEETNSRIVVSSNQWGVDTANLPVYIIDCTRDHSGENFIPEDALVSYVPSDTDPGELSFLDVFPMIRDFEEETERYAIVFAGADRLATMCAEEFPPKTVGWGVLKDMLKDALEESECPLVVFAVSSDDHQELDDLVEQIV